MAGFAFFPLARCRMAAGSLIAGAALVLVAAASPASAQYYSPFDYGYGPPPFPDEYYRPRPYRPAPSRVLPQSDVGALLRSMGFAAITPARRVGDHYVADATDGDGVRVRIRLNRYSGQVASVRPLARGERPLTPPPNVRTPPPKPTPAKPPQTAARPAPESQKPVPDGPSATAPASQGQAASPESPKPAPAGPATQAAATSPPAADAARPAPVPQGAPPSPESTAAATSPATPGSAPPPVRVIPGVAVPPSAAGEPPKPPVPAATNDAAISAGLGAGTATPGDSVSAGTASVLTRDAAKPAEKSGKEKKPSVN